MDTIAERIACGIVGLVLGFFVGLVILFYVDGISSGWSLITVLVVSTIVGAIAGTVFTDPVPLWT